MGLIKKRKSVDEKIEVIKGKLEEAKKGHTTRKYKAAAKGYKKELKKELFETRHKENIERVKKVGGGLAKGYRKLKEGVKKYKTEAPQRRADELNRLKKQVSIEQERSKLRKLRGQKSRGMPGSSLLGNSGSGMMGRSWLDNKPMGMPGSNKQTRKVTRKKTRKKQSKTKGRSITINY